MTVQVYIVTGAVEDILATESWPVRAFLEMDPALALCTKLQNAVRDARASTATDVDGNTITPGLAEREHQGRVFLKANDTRGLDSVERHNRPDYDVQQCKLDEGESEYAITVPTGKKAIQI